MQKTNPDASEPTPEKVVSLADLPDPPPRIQLTSMIVVGFFTAFAVFAAFTENWFGFGVDIGVIVMYGIFGYFRYRKMDDLHRRWRVAKILEKIVTTPTMREEANSIIFTFIFPSPEIMEELTKLAQKAK